MAVSLHMTTCCSYRGQANWNISTRKGSRKKSIPLTTKETIWRTTSHSSCWLASLLFSTNLPRITRIILFRPKSKHYVKAVLKPLDIVPKLSAYLISNNNIMTCQIKLETQSSIQLIWHSKLLLEICVLWILNPLGCHKSLQHVIYSMCKRVDLC
jgi:hypothetical protein